MKPPENRIGTETDLIYAAGQTVGTRERQEDRYGIEDFGVDGATILVVADGMGGHAGGAEAAECAVASFLRSAKAETGSVRERLRPALDRATMALGEFKRERPELGDAGCTLVAAAISRGLLSWISVGDSALLLLRNGKISRLNDDHSMRGVFAEMVEAGRMTEADAASGPNRSALRSALTGEPPSLIDAPGEPIALMPGDQIVLASDGIELLEPEYIAQILTQNAAHKPLIAVSALLGEIAERRYAQQDNATILLYRVLAPHKLARSNRFSNWLALALAGVALVALGFILFR